jgi:hypothetical protein
LVVTETDATLLREPAMDGEGLVHGLVQLNFLANGKHRPPSRQVALGTGERNDAGGTCEIETTRT